MPDLQPIAEAVLQRLRAEQDAGETGLALSAVARAEVLALAGLVKVKRPARQAATPSWETSALAEKPLRQVREAIEPAPHSQSTAPRPEPRPLTTVSRPRLVSTLLKNDTSPRATPAPTPVADPPPAPLTGSKVEGINAIRRKVWEKYSANPLPGLRKTMVFSVGDTDAQLMLVGEAPGAEEERLLEPFIGPAGQTLTKMLVAMGINREQVYISNIVKFRPIKTAGSDVGNRTPTPEEIAEFREYVMEEARLIKPEIILALGKTATQGLLLKDGAMKDLHGKFHDLEGIPVMVTYHPSWLLQYGSLANKRMVWEDLMLVMERLGMPISAKQRAFFLPKE